MNPERMPNAEAAIVAREKIVDYLLSRTHPEGAGKAAFFISFSFDPDAWEVLADALRDHASRHPVAKVVESSWGTRYAVDGGLTTPDGRFPRIRTIWMIPRGDRIPRLVTAHPLPKEQAR